MGWSYGVRAGWVVDAWMDACSAVGGSSNTFAVGGDNYFFETSRKEYADGAITGTIWKFVGAEACRKTGSFRIEGDGEITRAPAWLKKHSPSVADIARRYHETFVRLTPEERVAKNHVAFAAGSLAPAGAA